MKLEEILKKYLSEEVLTDEVKQEIETLFDANIKEGLDKKLDEEKTILETKYTTELKEFKEGLVEKLSDYMEETFDEWFETNKPTMVSEIKTSMADNVMKKLHGIFTENYINVKDEDVDIVTDLETKLEKSKDELNEIDNSKIELKKVIAEKENQIFEYQKAIEFTKLSEDMSVVDKEKLLKLIEDIEVSDIKTFNEKVVIIKEKYLENLNADVDVKDKQENPDDKILESDDTLDKYLPKTYV